MTISLLFVFSVLEQSLIQCHAPISVQNTLKTVYTTGFFQSCRDDVHVISLLMWIHCVDGKLCGTKIVWILFS